MTTNSKRFVYTAAVSTGAVAVGPGAGVFAGRATLAQMMTCAQRQ